MTLGKINGWLLAAVTLVVTGICGINFTTSYIHLFHLVLRFDPIVLDAQLTPVGIDGMLFVLAMVNVLGARMARPARELKKWRWILAGAVASTTVANGAFGAWWGQSGSIIAVWSPIALFVSVEAGLAGFRWAAEYVEGKARTAQNEASEDAEAQRRRRASEASRLSRERRKQREAPPPQWAPGHDNGFPANVQNHEGSPVSVTTSWPSS